MSKYQQYFQEMVEMYQSDFDAFKIIHDKYVTAPEKFQDEFNETGKKILEIIRRQENMLCSQQEGGKYGKYSEKLSEKFWEAIRAVYSKIDFVGIKYS